MTVLVDTTVPGDPVAKGRPRSTHRGETFTPRMTREAEAAVAWELKRARASSVPYAGAVTVTLRFRCRTRRRVDIDNLAKLVLDAGNGIVYVDDFQVTTLTVYADHGHPEPGTDIRIETA